MDQPDNAAKRLLEVLRRAKDRNQANMSAVSGWANVFGLATVNEGEAVSREVEFEVCRQLVQLHQLIDDMESQLRSIAGLDHDLFLRPLPVIRTVCGIDALRQGTLTNIMNQVAESDLTVLEFCSNELAKHHSESVVEENVLREFREQVDSLFDQIQESSIPKELKEFLLKQLEIIRRAVQEYRIRGIERLKEALERVTGSMILNEDLIKESKNKEEVSSFSRVFYRLVSIVTFASKVRPLIGPVAKAIRLLLPGDPNSIPPVDLPPSD